MLLSLFRYAHDFLRKFGTTLNETTNFTPQKDLTVNFK